MLGRGERNAAGLRRQQAPPGELPRCCARVESAPTLTWETAQALSQIWMPSERALRCSVVASGAVDLARSAEHVTSTPGGVAAGGRRLAGSHQRRRVVRRGVAEQVSRGSGSGPWLTHEDVVTGRHQDGAPLHPGHFVLHLSRQRGACSARSPRPALGILAGKQTQQGQARQPMASPGAGAARAPRGRQPAPRLRTGELE